MGKIVRGDLERVVRLFRFRYVGIVIVFVVRVSLGNFSFLCRYLFRLGMCLGGDLLILKYR